jgi:hypothetical protein
MIYDIVGGFAVWFLFCSILASIAVLTFSVLAPLFMKNTMPVNKTRYIRVSEKEHDFDQD